MPLKKDGIAIEVHGLKEMEKELLALSSKMAASTLRSALVAVGKPALLDMQASAPVGDEAHWVKRRRGKRERVQPGNLRKRIKTKSRINKKRTSGRGFGDTGVAIVKIGLTPGAMYGHFIEHGYTSEDGTRQPARPFITPAIARHKGRIVREFSGVLRKKIDAANRRASKAKK